MSVMSLARQRILNLISDMVSNLLYYNRKEDEQLPVGAIETHIGQGVITVDEIVERFRTELEDGLL